MCDKFFEPNVLLEITAPFTDPSIGAVSGALDFAGATANGLGLYWTLEKMVRRFGIPDRIGPSGSPEQSMQYGHGFVPAASKQVLFSTTFLVPMKRSSSGLSRSRFSPPL